MWLCVHVLGGAQLQPNLFGTSHVAEASAARVSLAGVKRRLKPKHMFLFESKQVFLQAA